MDLLARAIGRAIGVEDASRLNADGHAQALEVQAAVGRAAARLGEYRHLVRLFQLLAFGLEDAVLVRGALEDHLLAVVDEEPGTGLRLPGAGVLGEDEDVAPGDAGDYGQIGDEDQGGRL